MEFEKEFDIKIEDDQAQQIQTVGDAIDHVSAALNWRKYLPPPACSVQWLCHELTGRRVGLNKKTPHLTTNNRLGFKSTFSFDKQYGTKKE